METANDKVTKRSRDESGGANVATEGAPKSERSTKRRTPLLERVHSSRTAPWGLVPTSGAFMMTQDDDGRYRLYDAISQEILWKCRSRKEVKFLNYSPASNKIVGETRDFQGKKFDADQVVVWNLNTGSLMLLSDWSTHGTLLTYFNTEGTNLITMDCFCVALWDLHTGNELTQIELGSYGSPIECCFTTDDSNVIIAAASSENECLLAVFDIDGPTSARSLSPDLKLSEEIRQIVSSFNSRMLAVVSVDEIVVVDLNTEAILLSWSVTLSSVCFGYDDMCVIALGLRGTAGHIVACRIADGTAVFRIPWDLKSAYACRMQCSPSSNIFLKSWDANGHTVDVLDYKTGAILQRSYVYNHLIVDMYVARPTMILL
jgi:WD40 repeat protein